MQLQNIIAGVLIMIAAFLNAGMDALYSNFEGSIFKNLNPRFWNPYKSSGNKWKNGDRSRGDRFIFSSTLLVFLTDGWHLLKTMMLLCLAAAASLVSGWQFGVAFLCIFCGFFEISFRIVRK